MSAGWMRWQMQQQKGKTMTIKEFGENAEIVVAVKIFVNDEEVFTGSSYDIDGAIAELGRAERMNVIGTAIDEQYQDLPEPIEDDYPQEAN